jgi:hypothetical protein
MRLAGQNYTSRYILNRLTHVIMMPESGHPGDHAVSNDANIIIPNSLLMIYLAADPGQFPNSVVLASKWEYPLAS